MSTPTWRDKPGPVQHTWHNSPSRNWVPSTFIYTPIPTWWDKPGPEQHSWPKSPNRTWVLPIPTPTWWDKPGPVQRTCPDPATRARTVVPHTSAWNRCVGRGKHFFKIKILPHTGNSKKLPDWYNASSQGRRVRTIPEAT